MGFKFLKKYTPLVCETCENVVDEGATVGDTSMIYRMRRGLATAAARCQRVYRPGV